MTDFFEQLSYFLIWNLFWGMVLGTYLGTTIFPVIGTISGLIFGCLIGVACGIICGLVAILAHPYIFDRDGSLESYEASLSRVLSPVAGITAGLITFGIGLALSNPLRGDGTFIDLILRWTWLPTGLLAAGANFFISQGYSAQILKSTARRGFLPIEIDVTVPPSLSLSEPFSMLWHRGLKRWFLLLCAGLGCCLPVAVFIRSAQTAPPIFDQIQTILAAGFGAALGISIFWGYCALGNVTLLSVIKQTLYKRYFPTISDHWYRISLTSISFVFTCLLVWYTLIFAPVVAGVAAYHVYHTFALPEAPQDKAKRKEKNALALDENESPDESASKQDLSLTQEQHI